jgi:hypothetical protein
MACICGVWAALNISLLRQTMRGFTFLVLGGLLISIPFALIHPLLNTAFEIPGLRVEQGEYAWGIVLALEVAILLAGPWLVALRLAGIRRSEFTRKIVWWQIGYWLFFLVCMIAGLLPAFNP